MGKNQKSLTKDSPDWFARVVAIIGLVFGLGGLALSYYNYRWQTTTYKEGLEERIIVQLGSWRSFGTGPQPFGPKGKLAVEVVNIGLHPIYLETIRGIYYVSRAQQNFLFYSHDPVNTKESLRKLEPGEAANFTADLDFSQPVYKDIENADIEIQVVTTKKTFDQKARIAWVSITDIDVPGEHKHSKRK